MTRLRLPILAAATATLFGAVASAQHTFRCRDDGVGGAICEDGMGHIVHRQVDVFGDVTLTDQEGRQSRAHTDTFDNITIRDSDGNVVHGRTDIFGNTTYEDQNGHTIRCRASGLDDPTDPGATAATCQ
jgi:hypothetical protein